jgi:hypothetical protein
VDRAWAADKLTEFIRQIDFLWGFVDGEEEVLERVDPWDSPSSLNNTWLRSKNPSGRSWMLHA